MASGRVCACASAVLCVCVVPAFNMPQRPASRSAHSAAAPSASRPAARVEETPSAALLCGGCMSCMSGEFAHSDGVHSSGHALATRLPFVPPASSSRGSAHRPAAASQAHESTPSLGQWAKRPSQRTGPELAHSCSTRGGGSAHGGPSSLPPPPLVASSSCEHGTRYCGPCRPKPQGWKSAGSSGKRARSPRRSTHWEGRRNGAAWHML